MTHRENPFSVHRVRPGALNYLFPQGSNTDDLVARLAANNWWGEVVGPHGSGKTTLLAALIPRLRVRGFRVIHLRFRVGEHRLPPNWTSQAAGERDVVVVVDGMEQLGWLGRFRIKRGCRRRGWGLLATAHKSLQLPALWTTDVDLPRLERVVAELLDGSDWSVDDDALRKIHHRFAGDMREMLFCLYDLYEADQSDSSDAPSGPV